MSLCVGLESHSLIIMRPRRRKHGKGPVIDNRADKYPKGIGPRGSSSSDLTHVGKVSFVLP